VIRFGPNDWRMWAYGREANFSALYHHFSFGRSGHFVSSDGEGLGPMQHRECKVERQPGRD
jgi:hypothetical protein